MRNLVGGRDPRLDLFRGLALVMIYINHVPGQIYEHLTSRNFGHSDAAEAFVFMSGTAAAMAYGPKLANGLTIGAFQKIWGRSWLLYMVHIMLTMWAIAIFSSAALHFGGEELMTKIALSPLAKEPLAFFIGVATLTHQLGYVNILPMYAVLLLVAPFLIRLGQRAPLLLLGVSVLLWATVGQFRINLPNYPFDGGWFFNPLSWQLIFSLGLLTGLALRRGERFVPVKTPLVALALAWLAISIFWVNSTPMKEYAGQMISDWRKLGVPFWLISFDKTFAGLPRLSHFLALAYILSMPVIVPRIAASRWLEPLRLMGRHGLLVFAGGTALAITAQAIKFVNPPSILLDTALVWGGIALLFAMAWIAEALSPKKAAKPRIDPDVPLVQTLSGSAPHLPPVEIATPIPRVGMPLPRTPAR